MLFPAQTPPVSLAIVLLSVVLAFHGRRAAPSSRQLRGPWAALPQTKHRLRVA